MEPLVPVLRFSDCSSSGLSEGETKLKLQAPKERNSVQVNGMVSGRRERTVSFTTVSLREGGREGKVSILNFVVPIVSLSIMVKEEQRIEGVRMPRRSHSLSGRRKTHCAKRWDSKRGAHPFTNGYPFCCP